MTVGDCISEWLRTVRLEIDLPEGYSVMTPYDTVEVRSILEQFAKRYQHDDRPRLGLWGINPGRFGAGVTGLSFTDPYALVHQLDINTSLQGRRELSAEFISAVIDAYGGAAPFYRDVVLTAFSPLGFVQNSVNINFYDHRGLEQAIVPFVLRHIEAMAKAHVRTDTFVVLGVGKLRRFAEKYVIPVVKPSCVVYLDHPRFIMQYRRKFMTDYVQRYLDVISSAVNPPLI
jgi:Domain of unknown function (DUF4918)